MDEAEKWLVKNDPQFKNYKHRRNSEYPFHTARQEFLRKAQEIPVSNLWSIREKLKLTDEQAKEVIERLK